MHSTRFSLPLIAALAIIFTMATPAHAQTFTALANFDGTDGAGPLYGSLIQATNGNYYGTTSGGGNNDYGSVFKLTPEGKLTAIYSFCSLSGCADGQRPWSSLVLGTDGNLYGTTFFGAYYDAGTIFKMTIGGKLTTIYSFCPAGGGCTDGEYPVGLVQASNGNFYGAASNGGAHGVGSIFEISAAGKLKTLYSFCSDSNCSDGSEPSSGPMQASNGNLYGTTFYGGAQAYGTVYQITAAGQFKTLYSFCAQTNCADGSYPFGSLIQAADGNLYGTTNNGGASESGTVFEITTNGQLTTLYSFDGIAGGYPLSAPVQASDGNLYGVTSTNGSGGGTIYEITSAGVFNPLDSFCSTSNCIGGSPEYGLAQATNGTFYGTTYNGGRYGEDGGDGTVFSYSLGLGPLVKTVPIAAKPGARVIILGNNLTGSTSVTFNGTPATFTVESDAYITATVPIAATTGAVSVTTPTGMLNSNPVFQVLN
jgi:uncharacterized repeat protein (TIGR03803 family)